MEEEEEEEEEVLHGAEEGGDGRSRWMVSDSI